MSFRTKRSGVKNLVKIDSSLDSSVVPPSEGRVMFVIHVLPCEGVEGLFCFLTFIVLFLGIDPGIRKLGYGLIDTDGQVVLSGVILSDVKKGVTRDDQWARMVEIFDFFDELIQKYPITHIGMEKLFFTQRNQNNAEFVYGVRGMLGMLFRRYTLPMIERTPQEIKKHITGNGNASKELMLAVIKKIFTLTEEELKWHDAADALGIALMVKQRVEKEEK